MILLITTGMGQIRHQKAGKSDNKIAEYNFTTAQQKDSVKINIWGEINNPGVYYLDQPVDLITLISLAQGPTNNTNFSNIKVINNQKDKIKTIDITPYINKGKDIPIPQINHGSTVILSRKTSSKIYQYLSWTTRILSIFSIYFMIRYYYISG